MSDQVKKVMQDQQKGIDNKDIPIEEALQVISFTIGNEEFAVPILNIKGIERPIEYTRVPGTPDYVLGVFNLRGSVYPLINLRMKFGLNAIIQDKDTRYLVVHNHDEMAGFVIDKLNEAMWINQSDIDPVPETIGEGENLIQGIGKREDRLISILKAENLLKRVF